MSAKITFFASRNKILSGKAFLSIILSLFILRNCVEDSQGRTTTVTLVCFEWRIKCGRLLSKILQLPLIFGEVKATIRSSIKEIADQKYILTTLYPLSVCYFKPCAECLLCKMTAKLNDLNSK